MACPRASSPPHMLSAHPALPRPRRPPQARTSVSRPGSPPAWPLPSAHSDTSAANRNARPAAAGSWLDPGAPGRGGQPAGPWRVLTAAGGHCPAVRGGWDAAPRTLPGDRKGLNRSEQTHQMRNASPRNVDATHLAFILRFHI